MNDTAKISKNSLHTINYSSQEMAQFFDNQYFNSKRRKKAERLDNYTDLVRHTDEQHQDKEKQLYKILLHSMRNIAKTNYTIKETREQRRPRIQYCGYVPNSNDLNHIKLCKSDKGNLFFNGLANCGSFWRCPVCAVKISENKRQLLTQLLIAHQNRDLVTGFLTLTIRHKKQQTLKKSLDKLLENYRSFQNTRFFSRGKRDIGLIGQVKTLEITFSLDNGWHPHLHILFLYDHNNIQKIEKFQKEFIKHWANYKNNDATINAQNQQIINNSVQISDYVAKYDITCEMTKGNIKGSKGLTPFTALGKLALRDYENDQEKRLLYGLYMEYVEQTQGRHYVNISNDLKIKYLNNIKEFLKSDEQIVNEVTIDETLLKIHTSVWKLISMYDLQPLLINKYYNYGLDGVYSLLKYFKIFDGLDIEIDNKDIPLLTLNK